MFLFGSMKVLLDGLAFLANDTLHPRNERLAFVGFRRVKLRISAATCPLPWPIPGLRS